MQGSVLPSQSPFIGMVVPLSAGVTAVITLCEICTAITAANFQLHRLGQAEYGGKKKGS